MCIVLRSRVIGGDSWKSTFSNDRIRSTTHSAQSHHKVNKYE